MTQRLPPLSKRCVTTFFLSDQSWLTAGQALNLPRIGR
jgi:hypothetical protein